MDYIILAIALVAVVLGADNLVSGSAAIARRFGISDFVIGAVIVGIGTSFPELIVSSIGAFKDNVDVAIGNVVGSNIFNILGILGITAIIYLANRRYLKTREGLAPCGRLSLYSLMLKVDLRCAADRRNRRAQPVGR